MALSAPVPRSDLVFRPLADEWVVLDPAGKRLHVLNLTAALVWGHLDGRRSTEDLAALVWEAYGRSPDRTRVAHEVETVLRDFEHHGLLELRGTLQ